jgi:hypothetical protein
VSSAGGGDARAFAHHNGPVITREPGGGSIATWAITFAVSFVVLCLIVRPSNVGPAAYDAAAAVMYFDRIVSGARLEAFVNTTPKPLLTVAFGLGHAVAGWGGVSVLAIAATSAAVALGARFAFGLAGPGAAVLVGTALVLDDGLLLQTTWAHGLSWALAAWFAAGLAGIGPRPRYGVAGAALAVGALARPETLLLTALASVLLAWSAMRGRMPPGARWVLVAWVALPVASLHDLLLTGDPLWWTRVAAVSAAEGTPRSVATVLGNIGDLIVDRPAIALLGMLGVAALACLRETRVAAAGIASVTVGTGVLLILVAATGRQSLAYYYAPISVGLSVAAALGIAMAARGALGIAWRGSGRRPHATGVASVVGVMLLAPGLLSSTGLTTLETQRRIDVRAEHAAVALAPLVAALPSAPAEPTPGALVRADPSALRILVPGPMVPRLAIDLGLQVTDIGPLVPPGRFVADFHPNMIVYHDRLADPRSHVPRLFERDSPMAIDGVTFELVGGDGVETWIWRASP